MTNEEAMQTLYPNDVNAARLLRALSLLTHAVGLKYGRERMVSGWHSRLCVRPGGEDAELCCLLVELGLFVPLSPEDNGDARYCATAAGLKWAREL